MDKQNAKRSKNIPFRRLLLTNNVHNMFHDFFEDERMKETLHRLETTQQELLTQKEQMEDMQRVDELQNELMDWMNNVT